MTSLEIFIIIFFFFYLSNRATSIQICPNSSCSIAGPTIRFPFWLSNRQPYRCGYPEFDLLCNNRSQTIINLPLAGFFIVKRIDYVTQQVLINDPENCLPKRFLEDFNIATSIFSPSNPRNYTFFNCSSDASKLMFSPISCLSGENYTVVAVPSTFLSTGGFNFPYCREIKTVKLPRRWPTSSGLSSNIELTWSVPECGSCELRGGVCGFKSDDSFDVGCSVNPPSHGLPRSAKYGIIIGVGIPGLVCMIGLACFICGKIRTYSRRRHPTTELPTSIIPHSNAMLMGLDGPTIESYPKTVLGESGRLPKPNDGTCPICLSDYQPKDTLRTIPECNHYFHADCIDEWLKMNATCPLCRNSPDGSSLITPCSSSPSSSSSSMSSS
ncbi:hypothetical protein L1049_021812 [Liquidambar formosana]|uniref:RING-type E3 ubiquitin transferase n=1 Tax=Liquidambar formosana TaxID=63359 RepID=A0AAP0RBJ0_LIQFO